MLTTEFVIENRHVVMRSGMNKAGTGPRAAGAARQQAADCAATRLAQAAQQDFRR